MKWLRMALLACGLLFALGAYAKEAQPLADDEAVEQRLIGIAEDLRCLVCQNESLAGSRADLAEDLRREIRTLIRQGKSDKEVIDFLVTRYGDFVRYRPPFKPTTWLLWIGPFAFLAAGLGALTLVLRRRSKQATDLSPEEQEKARKLLAGDPT